MRDNVITDADIFDVPTVSDNRYSHEQDCERIGIKPKSCFQIMDEKELQDYMIRLRANTGVPECALIDKINHHQIINTAKVEGTQRRLTNEELIKLSREYKAKNKVKPDSLYSRLTGWFSAKKQRISQESDSTFTPLRLASEWPREDYDLPPLTKALSKQERDQIYNFDTLYRQVIFNFIDYVGALPASESHHHNWPLGLLKHSLEVAEVALKSSKTQILRTTTWNDIEAQRKVRWQYATFVIGLVHDIGKAITDMTIYCRSVNNVITKWNPTLTSLSQHVNDHQVETYFVEMNTKNSNSLSKSRYGRHEGVAAMMLSKILTPEAIHYLSSSPDTGFGLIEEINKVLNGTQSDEFLKKALTEGENTSVHLSYTKVRSQFHHRDRNASLAELITREMYELRQDTQMLKHVFNLGGDIFLRFPEAIQMLQSNLARRSPTQYQMSNLHPAQVVEELASASFIKTASADTYTFDMNLTKAVHNAESAEIIMERQGGRFKVIMLQHPSIMFGRGQMPSVNTAVVRWTNRLAIEFLNEFEVREFVINEVVKKEEPKESESIKDNFGRADQLKVVERHIEDEVDDESEASNNLGDSSYKLKNDQDKSEPVKVDDEQKKKNKLSDKRAAAQKNKDTKKVAPAPTPSVTEDQLLGLSSNVSVVDDQSDGLAETIVDDVIDPSMVISKRDRALAKIIISWLNTASINKVHFSKSKVLSNIVQCEAAQAMAFKHSLNVSAVLTGDHIDLKNSKQIVIKPNFKSIVSTVEHEIASGKDSLDTVHPLDNENKTPSSSEEHTPPLPDLLEQQEQAGDSIASHATQSMTSEDQLELVDQDDLDDRFYESMRFTEDESDHPDYHDYVNSINETAIESEVIDDQQHKIQLIIEQLRAIIERSDLTLQKVITKQPLPELVIMQWVNQLDITNVSDLIDQNLITKQGNKSYIVNSELMNFDDSANGNTVSSKNSLSESDSAVAACSENNVDHLNNESQPAESENKEEGKVTVVTRLTQEQQIRTLQDVLDTVDIESDYSDSKGNLNSTLNICLKLLSNDIVNVDIPVSNNAIKVHSFKKALYRHYKSIEDALSSINNGVKASKQEVEYVIGLIWLMYSPSDKRNSQIKIDN